MFRVTRKRPNPRRWFYRFGFAALAVLAGLLVVQYVLLPRLIRGKVDAALRELGLSSPMFQVDDASLWGTELRNLSDEDGDGASRLRVGAVSIAYGPVDASEGKIESITLRGAELYATLKDGALDLGPFSQRPGSTDNDKPVELPFKRLRLESSTLHLNWEGQAWWIPVSGVLVNGGGGRLTLEARTFAAGTPVAISAKVDPATGETSADVDAGDVNLASLISAVPPRLLPPDARAGGKAALHVAYRDVRGRRELAVKFDPRDAWAEATLSNARVAAEHVTLRCEATVDPSTGRPTAVTLVGDVGRITRGDQAARGVSIDVRPHEDALSFTFTAAGDGWRLGRLEGEARGLLVNAASSNAPPPPNDVPLSVSAAYQVSGALPAAVRAALAAKGVDVSRVGDVEVEGEADGFAHLGAVPQGREPWHVQTDTTQVSVAPADVGLGGGGGGATVRALGASLKLHAAAGPREADLRLLDDSWIDWQAVVNNDPARPLVGGDVHLGVLPADGGAPALRVKFTDAGPDVASAFRLRTDAPVSLSAGGVDARAGHVEWEVKLLAPASGTFTLDSVLQLSGGSLSQAASGISAGKIDVSLPITVNGNSATPGALLADDLKLGGRSMPAVKGSVALADTAASFELSWSPLAGANVNLRGSVAAGAAGRGFSADADLVVKPFKLTDGAALASVVPGMAGWNVTGTLGATGHVSVRDGRVEPTAVVTVDDVNARDDARSFVVEGLSGAVKVDSFSPFSTGVAQRLVASKLTTGKLALTDGLVEFRVERPRSILIEQTNWGWAGGRVYSHAFRIDPQKVDVDVVLYADGLRVSDLLALVAENRATGEGDLFGRVPLIVRWPNVTFGDGFLYTRPGAEGDLKFLDAETASTMLDQADPRFKNEGNFAVVKQRVIDALRDFKYDRLRVDLENDATKQGQLVARVNVHGKGRTGPKPQELDLSLNFRGLDEPLNAYVGFQQWLTNFGEENVNHEATKDTKR